MSWDRIRNSWFHCVDHAGSELGLWRLHCSPTDHSVKKNVFFKASIWKHMYRLITRNFPIAFAWVSFLCPALVPSEFSAELSGDELAGDHHGNTPKNAPCRHQALLPLSLWELWWSVGFRTYLGTVRGTKLVAEYESTVLLKMFPV